MQKTPCAAGRKLLSANDKRKVKLMTVTGIIMECNPFHEGHAYLLEEARRQTAADYIIVVMSGDYVQRGEPAVFDKYIRAEQILQAGADLVLELPLYAACGSAEYFARGGIALLDRLGVVTDLCFGSESGDTEYIMKYARMLTLAEGTNTALPPLKESVPDSASPSGMKDHDDTQACAWDGFPVRTADLQSCAGNGSPVRTDGPQACAGNGPPVRTDGPQSCAGNGSPVRTDVPQSCAGNGSPVRTDDPEKTGIYREQLQAGLRRGLSFPAARSAALKAAFESGASPGGNPGPESGAAALSDYPSSPNDLLAVEYCRALLSIGSTICPHAIPRIKVPSATDRRGQLLAERALGKISAESCFPAHSLVKDLPRFPLSPDDYSFQLLYALRMHLDQAEIYADISEDLAERIRRQLPYCTGFKQFRDLLKTRNLTLTRVSRSLLHLLLGIKKERIEFLQSKGMALYARPLALNRDARSLFSMIKKNTEIPFLSKLSGAGRLLGAEEMAFLNEEIRAEELYTMTLSAVFFRECGRSAASPAALKRCLVIPERQ